MRVALISDLHFGHHRAELVAPLTALLRQQRPELVLAAGDLVHRARPENFAQARAFLDGIGAPWLACPGNHDVPLLDLPRRVLAPYARYDAAVPGPRAVRHAVPGLAVAGLNSAAPLLWRRGHLGAAGRAQAAGFLAAAPPGAFRIAMLHHPLAFLGAETKELPLGHARALAALDAAGADLILTGHLHDFAAGQSPSGLVQLHAASALCARPEDPPNEIAMLEIGADGFTLTRWIAPRDAAGFTPAPPLAYARRLRPEASGRSR